MSREQEFGNRFGALRAIGSLGSMVVAGRPSGPMKSHVEWERGVGEVGGEQRHADTSRFEEAGDALGEPDDGGFRGDVWGAVRGFGAAGSVR